MQYTDSANSNYQRFIRLEKPPKALSKLAPQYREVFMQVAKDDMDSLNVWRYLSVGFPAVDSERIEVQRQGWLYTQVPEEQYWRGCVIEDIHRVIENTHMHSGRMTLLDYLMQHKEESGVGSLGSMSTLGMTYSSLQPYS